MVYPPSKWALGLLFFCSAFNIAFSFALHRKRALTDKQERQLVDLRLSECDDYFEWTPENRKDSSGDEFFMKWWSTVKDDPKKMEMLGRNRIDVFGLFGKDHWGSDSFTCNLYGDCKVDPDCLRILTYQVSHRNGRSDDEVRRDARNIWFAYKKLIVIAEVMSHAYISLDVVKSSIVAVTDDLIYHFTQQPDLLAEAQCQMAKLISDLLLAALPVGLNMIPLVGPFVAKSEEWVVVAYETFDEQAEKYTRYAKATLNNIQTASNIIAPIDGIVSTNLQVQQARVPINHNSTNANRPLHIMQDYQGDICSFWGAKIRDKSFGNSASTKKYVEDQFIHYEETISRAWNDAFLKNDNIEAQADSLRFWMNVTEWESGPWPKKKNRVEYESHLKQDFLERLMSMVWKESHCFVNCFIGSRDGKPCPDTDPSMPRYCPSPYEICQPKCWTTMLRGNYARKLYGMDDLYHWKSGALQVLKSSRDRLALHQNLIDAPVLNISMFSDGISLSSQMPSSVELPVCRGAHVVVVDFEANMKNRSRDFPCACGGWRAEQTAAFLNATGFGQKSVSYTQKWAKDVFTNLCPNTFRKVSAPLTFFLELCGLGVRYPFGSDSPVHYFIMEPDPRCDAFWKHTEGMDEREANIKFCQKEWPEVKWLFKDTTGGWTIDPGFHDTYETKCKKWMKKKEIKGWNQTQYILNISTMAGISAVNLALKDGYAGLPVDSEAISNPILVVDNVDGHKEFANLLANNEAEDTTSTPEDNTGQTESSPSITAGNETNANEANVTPPTIAENNNMDEISQIPPQPELESTEAQTMPEPPQADFSQGQQGTQEAVSEAVSAANNIGGHGGLSTQSVSQQELESSETQPAMSDPIQVEYI